jgi:hypothetical protein
MFRAAPTVDCHYYEVRSWVDCKAASYRRLFPGMYEEEMIRHFCDLALPPSLRGGLVPARFSRHMRGRDTPFLRYLYLCMVASYRHLSTGMYEAEIRHSCDICMVASYRRHLFPGMYEEEMIRHFCDLALPPSLHGGLVPARFSRHVRGRDTPFLRHHLCMVA